MAGEGGGDIKEWCMEREMGGGGMKPCSGIGIRDANGSNIPDSSCAPSRTFLLGAASVKQQPGLKIVPRIQI